MPSSSTILRWSSYITVGCFFLAGGIEYSVILPTMFDYLKEKGGEEWLYGLTLSAFSISNLITGPLYGLVFDKTHMTKAIVLFANLFEIGGNFMYFAATSKYMILGSRFIVGLGAGAGATIFGELARTTTKKQRTTVFSVYMALRQIGLVVGPAFNLFLRKLNFKIGPFRVQTLTAPGAFMAIVWIIIEVMFLLLFYQFPAVTEEETKTTKTCQSQDNHVTRHKQSSRANGMITSPIIPPPHHHHLGGPRTLTHSTKDMFKYSQSVDADLLRENSPLISDYSPEHKVAVTIKPDGTYPATPTEAPPYYGSIQSPIRSDSSSSSSSSSEEEEEVREERKKDRDVSRFVRAGRHLFWLVNEFLREEIVVLLSVLFMTMFNQSAIETMVVPMAQKLLKWTEFEISIFFSVAGALIIAAFIMVTLLSRVIGDRWQMMLGLAFELVGYSWNIGLLGTASSETPWVLWRFIVGAVFNIFGLPFFVVTGASLYSKFLPTHIQGFGQGVRRSVLSLATIMGPLWAGGAVAFSNYYALLGVPCALLAFVMVLACLSFPRLREPGKTACRF